MLTGEALTDGLLLMAVQPDRIAARAEDTRAVWMEYATGDEAVHGWSPRECRVELDEGFGAKGVLAEKIAFDEVPDALVGDRQEAPDVAPVLVQHRLMDPKDVHRQRPPYLAQQLRRPVRREMALLLHMAVTEAVRLDGLVGAGRARLAQADPSPTSSGCSKRMLGPGGEECMCAASPGPIYTPPERRPRMVAPRTSPPRPKECHSSAAKVLVARVIGHFTHFAPGLSRGVTRPVSHPPPGEYGVTRWHRA